MLHVVLRSKGAIKNYSFSFSHQNYKEATLKISNECKWRRYFRCMILTIFVRAKYYPLSETLIKKFDSFISRDINTRRYFLNFFPRECFFFFFKSKRRIERVIFYLIGITFQVIRTKGAVKSDWLKRKWEKRNEILTYEQRKEKKKKRKRKINV